MAKSPARSNREIRKPKAPRPQPETAIPLRGAGPGAAASAMANPARKPKGGA